MQQLALKTLAPVLGNICHNKERDQDLEMQKDNRIKEKSSLVMCEKVTDWHTEFQCTQYSKTAASHSQDQSYYFVVF